MATAFLIKWYKSSGRPGAKPMAFIILRILFPVTNLTWATPWESRKITPKEKCNVQYFEEHKENSNICFHYNGSQTNASISLHNKLYKTENQLNKVFRK